MRRSSVKTGEPWKEEEDRLLAQYQAIYGNRWSLVAKHIPGRNGQSVAQRWRHKVNPNIVRDKWTSEEDARLVELVNELGHQWATIARALPGRTDQQCMGRWRRHLDPSISKSAWSAEEDAQLLSLYQQHGSSWSYIAKCLTNRTPQQCRGRWCILSKCSQTPSPTAPETPHHAARATRRSCNPQNTACATGAATAGAATTELPSMPASAQADPRHPPSTVQQARRTTRSQRPSSVAFRVPPVLPPEDTEQPAGLQTEQRQRPEQGQGHDQPEVCSEEEAATESGSDGDGEGEQPAASAGATDPDARRQGRLHIGYRVVRFHTRRRTSQRRPRRSLAAAEAYAQAAQAAQAALTASACLSPPGSTTRSARSRPLASALALLSPPKEGLLMGVDDEAEAAMISGLLGEDVAAAGEASWCRAEEDSGPGAEVSTRVEMLLGGGQHPEQEQLQQQRPACSTGCQGCGGEAGCSAGMEGHGAGAGGCSRRPASGRRRAGEWEDETGDGGSSSSEDNGSELQRGRGEAKPMTRSQSETSASADLADIASPRRTRSGRTCPASYSTKPVRHRSRTGLASTTTASAATTASGSTATGSRGVAPVRSALSQELAAAAAAAAAGAGGSTAVGGGAPAARPAVEEAQAAVHAALQPEPVEAAAAAAPPAPHGQEDLASPVPWQAMATNGPSPGGLGLPLHEMLHGHANVHQLAAGTGAAGSGGGVGSAGALWQDIGSPPTSSLLALLQAGLLSTPTGTTGQPGLSGVLLNAPVPAGLPQVSAGVTNQWSDVPPVSWSEWKDRLGGFGVVGRVQLQQTHQPEAGGSSGTPDNTRPAQRAPEGLRGVGTTPRRDMFIRSASSSDASRAAAAALQEADAGMLPGEGAGGTHPFIGSPAGLGLGMRPRRTPRRASWHADQVVMARDGAGHACMDISPPRVHVPSGLETPKSPPQQLPDYCSPSKKQRKGWTSPAAAPQGALLPMLRLPMLPRPGSGPSSFLPMLNKPNTGLLDNIPGNLLSACASLPVAAPGPRSNAPSGMNNSAPPSALPPNPPAATGAAVIPPPFPMLPVITTTAPQPVILGTSAPEPMGTYMPLPPSLARALMPPPTSRARRLHSPQPAQQPVAGSSDAQEQTKPQALPMPALPDMGQPKSLQLPSFFPVLRTGKRGTCSGSGDAEERDVPV